MIARKVSFFAIPGDFKKARTEISVRDPRKNLVGKIIWDKAHKNHGKIVTYLYFMPVAGSNLTIPALRQIQELMESIELEFHDLMDVIIIDSQKLEQVSSNESSKSKQSASN